MLLPDEIAQTNTDALEPLSRTLDRRSAPNGRRQHSLQQKQTDILPPLTFDTPNAKVAWRQVTQLRSENNHLRNVIGEQQQQLQQLLDESTQLKLEFDKEVRIIHNGHSQEIEHYQRHLQELMAERNRLQDAHSDLERRYQHLSAGFHDAVEEEAQRLMAEATQAVLQAPEQAPQLLQSVVKTVELQVRQEENEQIVEILYLKREVQRMAALLEQERQHIQAERQQLIAWQYSIREHAALRQKTLHTRLHTRWKLISVTTSLGLLGLLVVLQLTCLALFHVPFIAPISFSIIAPIILCVALVFALKTPVGLLRQMYLSAPHRKKIKAEQK